MRIESPSTFPTTYSPCSSTSRLPTPAAGSALTRNDLYVPYEILERSLPYVRKQRPLDRNSKNIDFAVALMEQGEDPRKLARWLEGAEVLTRNLFIDSLAGDMRSRSFFARKPEERAAIERYKRAITEITTKCSTLSPELNVCRRQTSKCSSFLQRVLSSIGRVWPSR